MDKEIIDEFSVCDKCGYNRGFHVSFKRTSNAVEIILICPQCGQRYRIGWNPSLG